MLCPCLHFSRPDGTGVIGSLPPAGAMGSPAPPQSPTASACFSSVALARAASPWPVPALPLRAASRWRARAAGSVAVAGSVADDARWYRWQRTDRAVRRGTGLRLYLACLAYAMRCLYRLWAAPTASGASAAYSCSGITRDMVGARNQHGTDLDLHEIAGTKSEHQGQKYSLNVFRPPRRPRGTVAARIHPVGVHP